PTVGQTRAYLALTLVVALWGSYPAFAKLALRHLSPFMLVSLRTLLASAFLVALLFRRGWAEWRALAWPDVAQFAFLGFTGIFVSTAGTYPGIALTTASSAVILQPAQPVMAAIALGLRHETVEPSGATAAAIFLTPQPRVGELRAALVLGASTDAALVVGSVAVVDDVSHPTRPAGRRKTPISCVGAVYLALR